MALVQRRTRSTNSLDVLSSASSAITLPAAAQKPCTVSSFI
jgi:hypothetical protein